MCTAHRRLPGNQTDGNNAAVSWLCASAFRADLPLARSPRQNGGGTSLTLGGTHLVGRRNPRLQANLTDQTVNKCTLAFRPERCRTGSRCLRCEDRKSTRLNSSHPSISY